MDALTYDTVWDSATLKASRHALFQARAERLRETMRRVGVPVVLILDPNNILYATGASNMTLFTQRTPARYLLLFADGPSILYEYFGCEHLADGLPTIDEVRPAEGLCRISSNGDPRGAAKRFAEEIASTVRSIDKSIDRIAVDRFPFEAIDALRAQGFILTDSDAAFLPARTIKLPIEMPYMREAMRRVHKAIHSLEARIEPGASENEVWAVYHFGLMAKEGQYVSTRLFQSGERTFPYFQESSERILKKGDLVCLDTDALGYEGYAVDFSRSFLCGDGKPSDEQRRLYGLAREQLETNANAMRPGIAFEELADKAWPVPEEHQDSRYYCVGHGLGMSGEYPNIPHRREGKPYPIDGHVEPGMVICLESYIGSKNSGQGVKLENQYLVSEDGIERLSHYHFDDRLG
ncbi:MAG: Xaa-Pro peptidase family protein [Alphaproteobacteria bacterium]